MSRLTIHTVEFGRLSPPRTEVNRALRKMFRQPGAYNLEGSWWDFGLAESFYHLFQTQDDIGYVTAAQKRTLQELFDSGESFEIVTDLLEDDATVETFSATFDYASPPRYARKLYDGSLWAFVIPVYLTKVHNP